ncbi:uncharacterized protein K452DRAFT_285817 [Aplosporella prunicola CBS 121167]|uniref:Uncharacterized protein n=1 Tax=Aplosporella prunicola CBS 121167 TaxID=1176127 RepID=A0A6A6BLR2_9PEZI|nr:uncharacterized protein K452DRAFT_285817 [Aplosporella prunicola CBS 121167]KAF2143777.1 hypothetical protein K452DRAFT_285817 [Aplosporella prunicola CBS 121167]
MPVWPFGRRKGRRSRLNPEGPVAVEAKTANILDRRSSRRSRRRSIRRDSTNRTGSASRQSLTNKGRDMGPSSTAKPRHCADDITPLPATLTSGTSPHLRPTTREHADSPITAHPDMLPNQSHTSLYMAKERGKLQKRRSEDGPPRTMSTKRSRKDPIREEEIRQMSAPVPVKRSADNSGSMTRRDSKKARKGLHRHFDRPTSDLSLPTNNSLRSSLSGGSGSDYASFKVSSLDVFAPRPTIRYSGSPPFYQNPVDRAQNDSRADSRRKSPISKETLKESKTIDDLADDMDSGTLRELMERDARRKERKRQADEERLRRKLERRAEKQRQKEQTRDSDAATRAGKELNAALGLAIENGKPVKGKESTVERGTENTGTYLDYPADSHIPKIPSEGQAGTSYSPVPQTPTEDAVIEDAHAIRYSRPNMSPPHSPAHQHARGSSNVSELPELTHEVTPTASENPSAITRSSSFNRRSSDVSSSRRGGWWSAFRRRPSALKRRSMDQGTAVTAPSEVSFSNTSRESMGRQPLPPHLVQQPGRKRSGTPVRTQSKFREELPERHDRTPLSPPDSRVQSPEFAGSTHNTVRPGQNLRIEPGAANAGAALDDTPGKIRTDSPVSPGARTSAVVPASLASVDSEASWLSGKPMKRASNPAYWRTSFGSASTRRPREDFTASYEELGIPDDEYFRRLTPGPEGPMHSTSRKPSSDALAADADAGAEDTEITPESEQPEEAVFRNDAAHRPTVVHRQERAKSQEGLLSYWAEEAAEAEPTSAGAEDAMEGVEPATPVEVGSIQDLPSEEDSPEIKRASSVNIKNQVKRFSASSAKLLDISRSGSLRSNSFDPTRTGSMPPVESPAE